MISFGSIALRAMPVIQATSAQHVVSCAIFLMILSFPCKAADRNLHCPQAIGEQSIRLIDLPPGWKSFIASPLYLHGAAPTDGPPEGLGQLADYREKPSKGGWTDTYTLHGKFPDGKWLDCTYGENDQASLSIRLDDSVQVCKFAYRNGEHVGERYIAIDCK